MVGYNIANNSCLNDTTQLCPLRVVNGSVIIAASIIGFISCIWIVYNIVSSKLRLVGKQNIYILNVLICDSIISIIGVVRGLGILSDRFVGVTDKGEETVFCSLYPLASHLFWRSQVMIIVPLTIDRFVAVIFPFLHRAYFGTTAGLVLIGVQWSMALSCTLFVLASYYLGEVTMSFQPAYHRCTYDNFSFEAPESLMFFVIPPTLVCILYAVMLIAILVQKKDVTKLLRTSLLICTANVVVCIPGSLLDMGLQMDYPISQVLTVTPWYLLPVFNPLVYYLTHPTIKNAMRRPITEHYHNRAVT